MTKTSLILQTCPGHIFLSIYKFCHILNQPRCFISSDSGVLRWGEHIIKTAPAILLHPETVLATLTYNIGTKGWSSTFHFQSICIVKCSGSERWQWIMLQSNFTPIGVEGKFWICLPGIGFPESRKLLPGQDPPQSRCPSGVTTTHDQKVWLIILSGQALIIRGVAWIALRSRIP